MAVVKKANIVSLVAVIVIVFSVTIHVFADVHAAPKPAETKSENSGDGSKKLADDPAGLDEKAKPIAGSENEKLADDTPAEKGDDKSRSDTKTADKKTK